MVRMVQLTPSGTAYVGPSRIIPAADAQELLAGEQVLANAQHRADTLERTARERAGTIEAAAREAGLAAAKAEIDDQLTAIAVASLKIMAENEQRIVDMGLQIARRILEMIEPEEAAVQIALRSLKFVGNSTLVRLRVTPSLVEAVRGRLDEVVPAATSRAVIEVIADPRVSDAGCILETDAGLIDATIESQLSAIDRGLRGSLTTRNEA